MKLSMTDRITLDLMEKKRQTNNGNHIHEMNKLIIILHENMGVGYPFTKNLEKLKTEVKQVWLKDLIDEIIEKWSHAKI